MIWRYRDCDSIRPFLHRRRAVELRPGSTWHRRRLRRDFCRRHCVHSPRWCDRSASDRTPRPEILRPPCRRTGPEWRDLRAGWTRSQQSPATSWDDTDEPRDDQSRRHPQQLSTCKHTCKYKHLTVTAWQPLATENGTELKLHKPHSIKLNFGACSFHIAAPTVWNSLPADIRACTFYGSFTVSWKPILIMLFSMLLGHSDCLRLQFNVLSIECALQIVFMIMIVNWTRNHILERTEPNYNLASKTFTTQIEPNWRTQTDSEPWSLGFRWFRIILRLTNIYVSVSDPLFTSALSAECEIFILTHRIQF